MKRKISEYISNQLILKLLISVYIHAVHGFYGTGGGTMISLECRTPVRFGRINVGGCHIGETVAARTGLATRTLKGFHLSEVPAGK